MNRCLILVCLFLVITVSGCTTAVVGGGATGAYKIGTDERSVGQMWDDSAITAKIKAALLNDPITSGLKIDVDTLEGDVTLKGVVGNEEASERAVEIAKKISGVKSVENSLQIGDITFGQTIDDSILLSKIKAGLVREPGIRSLNIDVDVNNGVTTLTGIVNSQDQKARVIEIARTATGTTRLVDNIRVKSP